LITSGMAHTPQNYHENFNILFLLCVDLWLSRQRHTAFYYMDKKGKAVPLQAWSGPEGSRKLRFPHYMTTAQDVGKVVSLMQRPPLPPGKTPGTHFC
jgi:hypothetical protein